VWLSVKKQLLKIFVPELNQINSLIHGFKKPRGIFFCGVSREILKTSK